MSRSKKKHPFGGFSKKDSEKEHKQRTHRKMRATERSVLSHFEEGDEVHLPQKPRDAVNPWLGPKDGKQYLMVFEHDLEGLGKKEKQRRIHKVWGK